MLGVLLLAVGILAFFSILNHPPPKRIKHPKLPLQIRLLGWAAFAAFLLAMYIGSKGS